MKHGALEYYECIGEELKVPWGLTFPRLCKIKRDETVVFAFIVYKSKAHRNQVNAKVHKDPLMSKGMENMKMPFDMKRFAAGGFSVIERSVKSGGKRR